MTLRSDAIVWAFDGHDGRAAGLTHMLAVMLQQLDQLVPESLDDPFAQLAADFGDDPTSRMLSSPRLHRLFPPACTTEDDSNAFWRDSIGAQAQSRIRAATTVARACAGLNGWILVPLSEADDWVKTLSALRVFWYAELAGSGRLAQAPGDGSSLEHLVDWLGYLIEDLLETRSACLAEGHGLED